MNSCENLISSDISPQEVSEINQNDARQFDLALSVIAQEMPATLEVIKMIFESVKEKAKSIKTIEVNFDLSSQFDVVNDDAYQSFSNNIVKYVGGYELDIINMINMLDRHNSVDGSSIDNNFLRNLPFLGTLVWTIATYAKNGNYIDDLPQLSLDVTGNILDRDFNATLGNMVYNGTEFLTKNWNALASTSLAALALAVFEYGYDRTFVNTDPRQDTISAIEGIGDGIKIVAGNQIVNHIAIPIGTTVSTTIIGKLGEYGLAKLAGVAAGGLAGAGIVIVGSYVLSLVIDPVIDDITGETRIEGTSIPRNGGVKQLYSSYVKAIDDNQYNYSSVGRKVKLYDMTVSGETFHYMLQSDPVETYLGLEENQFMGGTVGHQLLQDFIKGLDSIPNDCDDIDERICEEASKAFWGGYMSIYHELNELGFDANSYVRNK